jgi:filamentous hemagglutinin family protein
MKAEMKKILLTLLLIATTALVLFLFKPSAGEPIVFEQMSEKAVFNLKDPAQIDVFHKHGLKVTSPHSNPQTLVRVFGHHGPISNLKVESPGDVFLINPDGLLVGKTDKLEWNAPNSQSTVAEPGNAYALAISEKGSMHAVDLDGAIQKPTTFEFPDFDEAPVISDE